MSDAPALQRSRFADLPIWFWPAMALLALTLFVLAIEYAKAAGWLSFEAAGFDHQRRVFGFSTFLKLENLVNILNNQSYIGIVAIGMTLVIIVAGIDLSVGSLVAASGVACIMVATRTAESTGDLAATLLGFATALGVGAAAGLLHGLLVAKGKMAAFVVTLGGLAAYRSIALTLADSGEVTFRGDYLQALANGGIPIPGTDLAPRVEAVIPLKILWPILIFFALAVVFTIVLNRTRLGRYSVAIGANERAARYSALPVDRVKIIVYGLLGLMTGLAALLFASRTGSISSGGTGILLELDAIAAVVIGGTRLSGGRGTILGTVLGVLILGVIGNMLVLLNVPSEMQGLVKGAVIVLAVLVQRSK